MRDLKNKLTSSKNSSNIQPRRGKSFGYQVLGFGAGGGLPFSPMAATGGTITTDGDYKIHTFTSPGTFCVSCAGENPELDYIVQAGGGGGGRTGGAGAGGLRFTSNNYSAPSCTSPRSADEITLCASAYPITIGGGGSGLPANPSVPVPAGNKPTKGSDSVFSTITSTGGGATYNSQSGATGAITNGGSGGAGVNANNFSPQVCNSGIGNSPAVTPVQGFPSTDNPGLPVTPEGPTSSGDGGGAGGNTANLANTPVPRLGSPGLGFPTDIMKCVGVPSPSPTVQFIGGGGGGGTSVSPTLFTTGIHGGGSGAGGTPGPGQPANSANPGTTNTGGGGGGGGAGGGRSTQPPQGGGGAGGSGIVVIRYKFQ